MVEGCFTDRCVDWAQCADAVAAVPPALTNFSRMDIPRVEGEDNAEAEANAEGELTLPKCCDCCRLRSCCDCWIRCGDRRYSDAIFVSTDVVYEDHSSSREGPGALSSRELPCAVAPLTQAFRHP